MSLPTTGTLLAVWRSAIYALFLVGCSDLDEGLFPRARATDPTGQFDATRLRTAVPCPAQTDRTLVAVAFGQSNSANSGERRHSSQDERVLNFYNGRCYIARDPLLGATGLRGTMWTPLGNELVKAGDYDTVILISIGIDGTNVGRWSSGDLNAVLRRALEDAKNAGYRVTHFFWVQGEADALLGTAAEAYADDLLRVAHMSLDYFPTAWFFVSLTSLCGGGPNAEVRAGQKLAISRTPRMMEGPDTDAISGRRDGCHLSSAGQDEAVKAWLRVIRSHAQARK